MFARQPGPLRAEVPDEKFEKLLDRVELDGARHTTAGPASEQELTRLEETIGCTLPASFRAFLARLGGGLYYERHEILGPARTMIHDIELVPPLTLVGRGLPAGVIPVHRANTLIHFMDLRTADAYGSVFSLAPGERYRDFANFLEAVVVPRGDAPGGP